VKEALDDDLNAPRAVAAVFAYMNEGHAAMDAGARPGPRAMAAWNQAESVLGVAGNVVSMKITGADASGASLDSRLSEFAPTGQSEERQKEWALQWALRRKQVKAQRDYPEADRIRAFLREAGWEVRDAKDGSVEVVRIKRAS
jgi:cysteinyl-tRNA synthetase